MNSNSDNPMNSGSADNILSSPGEDTLRLIANLPAPEGLEARVHAGLRAAPRRGRVLAWPRALHPENGWIRTAAAAAIVFVVAGGGWGIYTRVQQNQPAKVIVMPLRVPAAGGFSSAGAIRTPETLPGPTVTRSTKAITAQPKTARKTAAKGRHGLATVPQAQPAASQ